MSNNRDNILPLEEAYQFPYRFDSISLKHQFRILNAQSESPKFLMKIILYCSDTKSN